MNENFCCSTSSLAFSIVSILDSTPILIGVQWYVIILICISLMTYDVEHQFTYWVGQKVHLNFSISCYKNLDEFLAIPILICHMYIFFDGLPGQFSW